MYRGTKTVLRKPSCRFCCLVLVKPSHKERIPKNTFFDEKQHSFTSHFLGTSVVPYNFLFTVWWCLEIWDVMLRHVFVLFMINGSSTQSLRNNILTHGRLQPCENERQNLVIHFQTHVGTCSQELFNAPKC